MKPNRVCGLGSPPRMRGKGRYFLCTMPKVGITPAYAGKSCLSTGRILPYWDHPRVCGEKPNRLLWQHWKEGSPPRMRGKEFLNLESLSQLGITPAYAGKSRSVALRARTVRDHPRVCGEKRITMLKSMWKMGSPPRMRGKDSENRFAENPQGITPAYAGKSLSSVATVRSERDHPRVCGEKTKKIP